MCTGFPARISLAVPPSIRVSLPSPGPTWLSGRLGEGLESHSQVDIDSVFKVSLATRLALPRERGLPDPTECSELSRGSLGGRRRHRLGPGPACL